MLRSLHAFSSNRSGLKSALRPKALRPKRTNAAIWFWCHWWKDLNRNVFNFFNKSQSIKIPSYLTCIVDLTNAILICALLLRTIFQLCIVLCMQQNSNKNMLRQSNMQHIHDVHFSIRYWARNVHTKNESNTFWDVLTTPGGQAERLPFLPGQITLADFVHDDGESKLEGQPVDYVCCMFSLYWSCIFCCERTGAMTEFLCVVRIVYFCCWRSWAYFRVEFPLVLNCLFCVPFW